MYSRSLRWYEAAVSATRVLFEGIWLGALDVDGLYEIDSWYYAQAREYAAEVHNRGGLYAWERSALERFFPAGGRILVSAVGGGREIRGLLEAGYDADGFECNEILVAAAQQLLAGDGQSDRVRRVDRGGWPPVSRPYDGVILGWGSYTLGPTADHRADMLRGAAASVNQGAPILLSFLAVERFGRGDRLTASLANVLRRLRRRPPVSVGDRMAPNFVHVFTREQIEREVATAGLELRYYSAQGYGHAVAVAPAGR